MNNGNFRFGLSKPDRDAIIPNLQGQNVFINLPGIDGNIQVTHDTFFNHGNLFSTEISDWIIENNYSVGNNRSPFKLIFRLSGTTFQYYQNQGH
jgi:hypothetical protein